MKTRTKGAIGDKKIAKDLRDPNLSKDGKWRSFAKVPNLAAIHHHEKFLR